MNFKAEDAKNLLNNQLFNETFEKLRDKIVNELASSKIDEEKEKHLVIKLKLLNSLKSEIESYINTGKIEEFNLKKKRVFF